LKLFITTEQHFYRLPNGHILVKGVEDASFFQRYLDEFEEVIIVGRVQEVSSTDSAFRRVNKEGILFFPLKDFVGISGLFKNMLSILKRLNALVRKTNKQDSTFILRTPGIIADLVWLSLTARKLYYGVEVVSDPFDMYGKKSVGVSFSSLFQKIGAFNTKKQCEHALTSAYVTKEALQRRYPPGNKYTYSYTSLNLDERAFNFFPTVLEKAQAISEKLNPIRLIFVGTLGRPYKGQDVLFKAVQKLKKLGYPVRLKVIGSGRMKSEFEQMVKDLGINELTEFTGQLEPGLEIYQQLAGSDIFVLPSRQEGLPRVLIEAMAVGLPCIATDVGGVFELLEEDEMIEVDDLDQLVDKIIVMAEDKVKRLKVIKSNQKKAQQYRPKFVQEKRNRHYRKLIERSINR
jgi:glycosyltransferase involved in cell wall biosynthesis